MMRRVYGFGFALSMWGAVIRSLFARDLCKMVQYTLATHLLQFMLIMPWYALIRLEEVWWVLAEGGVHNRHYLLYRLSGGPLAAGPASRHSSWLGGRQAVGLAARSPVARSGSDSPGPGGGGDSLRPVGGRNLPQRAAGGVGKRAVGATRPCAHADIRPHRRLTDSSNRAKSRRSIAHPTVRIVRMTPNSRATSLNSRPTIRRAPSPLLK